MEKLVKILKVLADKNRLRILKLLEHKRMCVCELAFVLGITQPSVSRHLKKLKSAGVITEEQDSFWTNYFISKTDSLYIRTLLNNLTDWLNEDEIIKRDLEKAKKADRNKLCFK